jgi:hypothetical protein
MAKMPGKIHFNLLLLLINLKKILSFQMAIVPLSKAFNVILSLSGHHLVDKRRKPIWHKLQMALIVLTMAFGKNRNYY